MFAVRSRQPFVWVDHINATDADRLADILSHIDWRVRPPKIVRFVRLIDPRQVVTELTALTKTDADATQEFEPPWSVLETAISHLAEAGPTVLVLFDVGRYLADDTRGRHWAQVRQICQAAADAGLALVALSSDSSHQDAQRLRGKFRVVGAGPSLSSHD